MSSPGQEVLSRDKRVVHPFPKLVMCSYGAGGMSALAQAFMTNYHRLGGLNNRHFISHGFGGWKSNIKVLADRVSDEGLLTGLQMAVFTWYLHGVEREGGRERMLWFLLLRTLIPPRGPTLMTSLNVMTLKAPHPNTIPLGVRASTYEFGRVTIQSVAGNLLELYFI